MPKLNASRQRGFNGFLNLLITIYPILFSEKFIEKN